MSISSTGQCRRGKDCDPRLEQRLRLGRQPLVAVKLAKNGASRNKKKNIS